VRGDRTSDRHSHLPFPPECLAQAKRGFRWRRPRHTLKGRQNAREVERVGLRLQLRRQQAQAGDIVLLPGQARKVAIIGALDATSRELIVHTSATKRSTDFIALLEQLNRRFGPRPGRRRKPVVLVLDNGPIHTSKASMAALAARPWITVEWLPRYAPELNDIEVSWRDLKRHHLAHRTFADANELDRTIRQAVADLNQERQANPCDSSRIAA
jgi:transposase